MVEVHWTNPECDETYEVEPDGLGMCGDEMIIASMLVGEGGDFEDASADLDPYLGEEGDMPNENSKTPNSQLHGTS